MNKVAHGTIGRKEGTEEVPYDLGPHKWKRLQFNIPGATIFDRLRGNKDTSVFLRHNGEHLFLFVTYYEEF